jgi:hypothetical protein
MWISKVALVIKFLGDDWQPKHITLGLFEPNTHYWTNFGQKVEIIVGQLLYIEKKNYCICQR